MSKFTNYELACKNEQDVAQSLQPENASGQTIPIQFG